ncbi:hypothetical protein [Mammaliicoccus sp. Dog046]|uniref:hypothetical protein n=1 Tax=Mammaliicoccus sp. Dog046 TaxID=3034233 RepID=UPI002B263EA1|nr:hypothetical protein [Mammaliicoccus sp. Dog046]WQK84963.1 hypothetical protein P3U32_10055 [Mammaliicoccus sp. Dog046]
MHITKSRNIGIYTKKEPRKLDLKKLKKTAIRVNEVNGRIKLDKNNPADVDWYNG